MRYCEASGASGSDSNFLGPLFAAEQPLTPVMSDG